MRAGILPSLSFDRRSATVRWVCVPTAYTVFVIGFLLAAAARSAERKPTWEDAVMSELLSRQDNPRGYFVAIAAVAVCAMLLFPAADLIQEGACRRCAAWRRAAAWLYRAGLFTAVANATLTPWLEKYGTFHVSLAFFSFMVLTAALAIVLIATAFVSHAGRVGLAALGLAQVAALLFLTYLYFASWYFVDRRWLLGLFEWAFAALVAVGTIVILARDARCGPLPPEAVDLE